MPEDNIAWSPDDAVVERARLSRLMSRCGVGSSAELHDRSIRVVRAACLGNAPGDVTALETPQSIDAIREAYDRTAPAGGHGS